MSNKNIDVISYGNVFGGEGFKAQGRYGGGLRMFVRDYDNNWFTTNNRDWEPEIPVLAAVTFNIVTKFKKKEGMRYTEMLAKEDPSMYPLTPTCCLCGSERMDWRPNTKKEQTS